MEAFSSRVHADQDVSAAAAATAVSSTSAARPHSPTPPPAIRVLAKAGPRPCSSAMSPRLDDMSYGSSSGSRPLAETLPSLPSTTPPGASPREHRVAPAVGRSVPALSDLLRQQFTRHSAQRPLAVACAGRTSRQLTPLPRVLSTSPSELDERSDRSTTSRASARVTGPSFALSPYAVLVGLPVPSTLDATFALTSAGTDNPDEHKTEEKETEPVDATEQSTEACWQDILSPQVPANVDDDTLALSDCGFFKNPGVLDTYSLLELYRIRCWQLGVKRPDPRVEAQLPAEIGQHVAANLTSIDLRATYVGSVGCLALAAVIPFCTALRSLTLTGVGLVENSLPVFALLRACRCCPQLLFLDLSFNHLGDVAGRWLLQLCHDCPRLRVVRVEQAGLSEPVLRKLQRRLDQRDGSTDGPPASASTAHAIDDSAAALVTPPVTSLTPWSARSSGRASPSMSAVGSWRLTPPHGARATSPTPSNASARTRLSYATPVRSPQGGDSARTTTTKTAASVGHGPDGDAHAIGYELLGSAGAISRLGRSGDRLLASTPATTASLTPVASPRLCGAPAQPIVATAVEDAWGEAADPAEVAAWIRDQRTRDRIAASLQHATNDELYDHTRHEDLDHASQKRVPEFVAAALVELRRRLARNGHAMQRIYDCFLLSDELEAQIKMGRAGLAADGEVARLTRRRTHADHQRWQRDILRSSTTTQTKAEALVHMELLQSNDISEEQVRQVQQGVCSWKAFFRGLRILGIDSAATDLTQATRFASVCGILTVEHICFGKLLDLLRPHVAFCPLPSPSGPDGFSPLSSRSQLSPGAARTRRTTASPSMPSPLHRSLVQASSPSSRTRRITWDASPPRPPAMPSRAHVLDPLLLDGAPEPIPSSTSSRDVAVPAEPAEPLPPIVSPSHCHSMSAQQLLDRLFDARHVLRRALAAITLDPNRYSTLLFQTARSVDLAQHDSIRSDDWIVLEASASQGAPEPTRASVCHWPQTNLLDRSVDNALHQWRRASLHRASLPSGEAILAGLVQPLAPLDERPTSSSTRTDAVRLSMSEGLTTLSPLTTNLVPTMDMAQVSAEGPRGAGEAVPGLLVPYSSVLQTCVAVIGREHLARLRTVLTRCFTGLSPFPAESQEGGSETQADEDVVVFRDEDDRLVDAERDLLQALSLRAPPPAPPADEERAAWRVLHVAELQRMIQDV